MAYKPKSEDMFSRTAYGVMAGGITAFETTELTDDEENAIREYLEREAEKLANVSPKIARTFRDQIDNIVDFCVYFKAKVDNAPYNADHVNVPNPNEIGLNMLIPQFMGVDYWQYDLTAGTTAYLWGSSTTYYTTTSTAGQRYMIFIVQDGILHVGQTPVTKQFKYETEKVAYAPYTIEPIVDQPIEEDKLVYQYETPGAFLLTWDLGTRLSIMPEVTANDVDFRFLGVVAYEYSQFSSLKW